MDTSIGIATDWSAWGSIPARGEIFLFSIEFRPVVRPAKPPIQFVPGALSPWVKRQGREADHSPPSSTKIKNGGVIHSVPNTSSWCGALLIKHKENYLLHGMYFRRGAERRTADGADAMLSRAALRHGMPRQKKWLCIYRIYQKECRHLRRP
jgi:hypothetical protein